MKTIKMIMLMLVPGICIAQEMKFNDNLTITQPVFKDLYIAGGTVTVNAPVHGDLIAAGGTVIVNDSITNDLIAAGGDITLNGNVGDDIRFAGGKLFIGSNVGGDLVVTGGSVEVSGPSVVSGSLIASGGRVKVDGKIGGFSRVRSGGFILNGQVGKNLDVRGGQIQINGQVNGPSVLAATEGIKVGRNAAFNNRVNYWSGAGYVNFGKAVKNGRAVEDEALKIDTGNWKYLGFASVMALLWYLAAALVFIIVIQSVFRRPILAASAESISIARSIGFGFLFFILVPVAIVVLFVTLIGIPLAFLMTLLFLVLIMSASIITSVYAANWINLHYYKNTAFWRQVWTAFLIFIILKTLSLSPFIGFAISAIAVLLAFGALLIHFGHWRKEERPVPAGPGGDYGLQI